MEIAARPVGERPDRYLGAVFDIRYSCTPAASRASRLSQYNATPRESSRPQRATSTFSTDIASGVSRGPGPTRCVTARKRLTDARVSALAYRSERLPGTRVPLLLGTSSESLRRLPAEYRSRIESGRDRSAGGTPDLRDGPKAAQKAADSFVNKLSGGPTTSTRRPQSRIRAATPASSRARVQTRIPGQRPVLSGTDLINRSAKVLDEHLEIEWVRRRTLESVTSVERLGVFVDRVY